MDQLTAFARAMFDVPQLEGIGREYLRASSLTNGLTAAASTLDRLEATASEVLTSLEDARAGLAAISGQPGASTYASASQKVLAAERSLKMVANVDPPQFADHVSRIVAARTGLGSDTTKLPNIRTALDSLEGHIQRLRSMSFKEMTTLPNTALDDAINGAQGVVRAIETNRRFVKPRLQDAAARLKEAEHAVRLVAADPELAAVVRRGQLKSLAGTRSLQFLKGAVIISSIIAGAAMVDAVMRARDR